MGRSKPILAGLLLLLALLAACGKTPRPEAPEEPFSLNLTPVDNSAGIGDTLTLTGSINSVEGLFAISFDLVFDTSVVAFLSVSSPQGGILGQNSISFADGIEDGASVSLGRIQTSGNDNVSASGPLFEVQLIAVGAGTTDIQYRDVYIIDENGIENGDLGVLEVEGAGVSVM